MSQKKKDLIILIIAGALTITYLTYLLYSMYISQEIKDNQNYEPENEMYQEISVL